MKLNDLKYVATTFYKSRRDVFIYAVPQPDPIKRYNIVLKPLLAQPIHNVIKTGQITVNIMFGERF